MTYLRSGSPGAGFCSHADGRGGREKNGDPEQPEQKWGVVFEFSEK